jgi:hypothetical protein
MAVSKGFIKSVFDVAALEFGMAGWTKRKTNIVSLDLSPEAYGCVGLNKAVGHLEPILEINPVVSVGNHQVEKLIAEFTAQKFEPYTTAAIGANVGYLMPEGKYRPWLFQEGDTWQPLVTEMVAIVEKFGRPFMQQNTELAALYSTLLNSKRGTPPDPLDYRIAVAAMVLGKRTEATEFVDAKLREIGDRPDAAAAWFRQFAAKLREHTVSRRRV